MLKSKENSLLSKITLITSIGDFLSFFAVLKWISDLGFSPIYSGYSVVIKSLAIAVSGIIFPSLLSKIKTKTIIVYSQFLSSFFVFLLIGGLLFGSFNINEIFIILFFQTILKQFFEAARETHSKSLGENQHQMSLQTQLLSSFYSAQFVGPIISFAIIYFCNLKLPLFLDFTSFFIAGLMSLRLSSSPNLSRRIHILEPLKYLWHSPKLRDIVLLRSVGFWIGMGLFNYFLFEVVAMQFHLDILNSAWIYSAIGLGASFSTYLISNPISHNPTRLGKVPEAYLALLGHISISIIIVVFLNISSFITAGLLLVIFGIAMGINAISTQSLRRIYASSSQFPEVVGLELIVGRLTDVFISTLAKWTISSKIFNYQQWLFFGAFIFLINGFFHLRFTLPNGEKVMKGELG